MIRIRPIWHGVPCITEEESADRSLCEQLAMMDGRWVRMDLLELLVIAMTERGLGNDKGAFEYLDAAAELFGIDIKKPKRGRKLLANARDLDASAIDFMDHVAKKQSGKVRAESLARFALRNPRWRRADKTQIGQSDIKRLARKWAAKRDI